MSDLDGFATIPRAIQRDTGVSWKAKLVYLALSSRANKHLQCWPDLERVAEESSCSVASVQRALKELRDIGAITWVKRTRGVSGRASNLYTLGNGHTAQYPGGNGHCDQEVMVTVTKERKST